LDVVDRLEDKVEETTYEDLVPIEVKLALENRIFGWSHLTTSILGHIAYPLASFCMVYFFTTQAYALFLSFQYHRHQKHNQKYDQDDNDGLNSKAHVKAEMKEDMFFQVTRMILSLIFAINTFRTIRRRRDVWFRAAYGTKEYYEDAERRKSLVRESDRGTLLGRLRKRRKRALQRKLQKRLTKAHQMFQKRQQRQAEESRRISRLKSSQQEQQGVIPENEAVYDAYDRYYACENDILCPTESLDLYSPCEYLDCGGEYDGVDNDYFHADINGDSSASDDELVTTKSLMVPLSPLSSMSSTDQKRRHSPPQQSTLESGSNAADAGDGSDALRMKSFSTRPCDKMESIMHDQVLLPPILNMPYAHGGFFGAAPFMLANPHWISILRHLMPDVYVEISRRVAYAPASRLIHWAENNPVVAAYGVAHDLEFGDKYLTTTRTGYSGTERCNNPAKQDDRSVRRMTPNLEWDVFLNPELVWQVESVLAERDKYLSSILPIEHYPFYERQKPLGLSLDDWLDVINEAASGSSDKNDADARIEFTPSQRSILKYYADQLEARAQLMVDKMLIAHGKLLHLIYEVAGFAKSYNYSRVKRTRRTLGGGIYAQQWMAVYAEALKLGLYNDFDAVESVSTDGSKSSSTKNGNLVLGESLDVLASNMCPDYSISESVHIIQSILRRRGDGTVDTDYPVGLVLDIKSRHISKRVWACVVDILRSAGVRVVGLASFAVEEIRGISKFCSQPLMEVIFFHSAGDLQRACHDGKIRRGDKVFFNGGSLLWEGDPGVAVKAQLACGIRFDPDHIKRSYRILPFGRTRKMFDAERTVTSFSTDDLSTPGIPSSQWMQGSTIELYKERYDLSIGLYVQEFAIDEKAAQLLIELVNENPHVYDLGLSWGGVNGITIRGIQPSRFTNTDGLWNQRYIGELWKSKLYPPSNTGRTQEEMTVDS